METRLTNINILTVGDRFVGKTSLVKCFMGKQDSPFEYQEYVKKVVVDDSTYKLLLRSSKGIRSFFKRSMFFTVRGIILVFDVTKRESFDNLRIWLAILDHLEPALNVFYPHPSHIPKILIGKFSCFQIKETHCLRIFKHFSQILLTESSLVSIFADTIQFVSMLFHEID